MTDKKKSLSKCTTRKDVEDFFLSRGIPKNHFETRSIALLALMGNPQMSFVGCTTDKQKYEMVLESFLCGTWKYAEQLKTSELLKELTEKIKQQAEQIEKLKCCGNCKNTGDTGVMGCFCYIKNEYIYPHYACEHWEMEKGCLYN